MKKSLSGVVTTCLALTAGSLVRCSNPAAPSAASSLQLVFTAQPTNTLPGGWISVQVAVENSTGHIMPTDTTVVTITLGANPNNGLLSGTTAVRTVHGVATLDSLRINKFGAGYTVTAAASGLTGATSSAFDIVAGVLMRVENDLPNKPVDTISTMAVSDTVYVQWWDRFHPAALAEQAVLPGTVCLRFTPPDSADSMKVVVVVHYVVLSSHLEESATTHTPWFLPASGFQYVNGTYASDFYELVVTPPSPVNGGVEMDLGAAGNQPC